MIWTIRKLSGVFIIVDNSLRKKTSNLQQTALFHLLVWMSAVACVLFIFQVRMTDVVTLCDEEADFCSHFCLRQHRELLKKSLVSSRQ